MRFPKLFAQATVLLTLPSVALYPLQVTLDVNTQEQTSKKTSKKEIVQDRNDQLLTFDAILNLIDDLESGELEKRCSLEDLTRINHFFVKLAREGLLKNSNDTTLESDIEELLQGEESPFEYAIACSGDFKYSIIPVYYDSAKIILCKSWLKKKWEQAKKFVKHHKKAILIGAAVVAAVAAVVAAVAAVSTAAAAAAGAAASGSDHDEKNSSREDGAAPPQIPQETKVETQPAPLCEIDTPIFNEIIQDQISTFKDLKAEDPVQRDQKYSHNQNGFQLGEEANTFASFMTHEIFEVFTELVGFIPRLTREFGAIGAVVLPEGFFVQNNDPDIGVIRNFESWVSDGHRNIDQAFSTELAGIYTSEAKNNGITNSFVIAELPLPTLGGSSKVVESVGRIAKTEASTVRGWKVKHPIINLTESGNIPKWSTVRSRYWKNRAEWAKTNAHKYSPEQLQRMEQGLAPRRFNKDKGCYESRELHHDPSQKDGGLFDFIEVWPDEHAALDPNRHIGG